MELRRTLDNYAQVRYDWDKGDSTRTYQLAEKSFNGTALWKEGEAEVEVEQRVLSDQLYSESVAILGKIKKIEQEKCRAKLFNQTVSWPGCESRVVRNRFCYGRCNSFYIPLNPTEATTHHSQFKTCSACRPVERRLLSLHLKCASEPNGKRKVSVEKVLSCRCEQQLSQHQPSFFAPA